MTISVALCTYNGEKYIEQQLSSILSQTVAVTEIVIMDDCSSDGTVEKIERISRLHPGIIRLTKNKENIGFRKNFEKALRECKGDFIFFSDQDDIWYEGKVKRITSHLKDTGMWGVFTDADLIDSGGNKNGTTLFEVLKTDKYLSQSLIYPDLFIMLCLNVNFVTGATMALTKEGKNIVLPFKTSEYVYHDHYIALKLSAMRKFTCLNEKWISYRLHPGQQIGVGEHPEKRDCLYNILCDTEIEDSASVKATCSYLMGKRRNAVNIIRICCFSREERRLLTRMYKELLFSIMSHLRFLSRCMYYARFVRVELWVWQNTWRNIC